MNNTSAAAYVIPAERPIEFDRLLENTRSMGVWEMYLVLEPYGACECAIYSYTPAPDTSGRQVLHYPACVMAKWQLLGEALVAAGLGPGAKRRPSAGKPAAKGRPQQDRRPKDQRKDAGKRGRGDRGRRPTRSGGPGKAQQPKPASARQPKPARGPERPAGKTRRGKGRR